MCKIATIPITMNKHLWKRNVKEQQHQLTHEDILHLIPRDIMEEDETSNSKEGYVCNCDENVSDISNNTNNSNNSESNILRSLLNELVKINTKDIWRYISPRMLYKYYLADANAIGHTFVHTELNAINKICKQYTGQAMFRTSDIKRVKIDKISEMFGNKSLWKEDSASIRNPKSLKDIAFKEVSSGNVPKAVIAVSVSRIKHHLEHKSWEDTSHIPLQIYIEHKQEVFKLYSFPEYSQERKQLEPRTLDPTHILTNLRAHACRSGFDFFDKESFIRVSQVNNTILSRAMVEHVLDQQNAEMAKRTFSKEVQKIMESNGDHAEALFVEIVREWYEACDERGIHPKERVNRWICMHNFLTKDINFTDYPPPTMHYKGIPIITFEGILQGISTRLSLYDFALASTFNNRAISTLGIEIFFSSLSKADFTMTGCPKAVQIHQIIPIMMEYNTQKHNPNKILKMDCRRGTPYPSYHLDVNNTQNNLPTQQRHMHEQFKPHNFDKYVTSGKKRNKFNPTIGGPNATQRGKLTIRADNYKFNMSKLSGLQLLGMPEDTNV